MSDSPEMDKLKAQLFADTPGGTFESSSARVRLATVKVFLQLMLVHGKDTQDFRVAINLLLNKLEDI